MKRLIVAAAFALAFVSSAFAQSGGTTTRPTWYNGTAQSYISTANPLPTSTVIGSASFTPLTPMQTAIAITSSTALTLPSGATYAVVCAEGANVRYTTDGTTTPTASVGMPLLQNQCMNLQGATTLSNFRAIQQSATATLDANYFK